MENKSKISPSVFWVIFLLFHPIGLHVLCTGRMKEFYTRSIIMVGVFFTNILIIISMIVLGDFYGIACAIGYKLQSKSYIFLILPSIIVIGLTILAIWFVIDFFRIITGKYFDKNTTHILSSQSIS